MISARPKLTFALPWAALLVLLFAVMAPGLHGGFFFDDHPNIVSNQAVHVQALSLQGLAASTQGMSAGPLGRPVSVISFALTHYFFGLDAWAFKAVNLVIHAVNGLLVAWLLHLFLRGRVDETAAHWLPLWVAAAWLLHPINVTPVLLAVQRMTLLSATFLLLACIAHLKAFHSGGKRPDWRWLVVGWLVFWPLSFFSKENGLLLPLFVLAAALFAPASRQRWQRIALWASAAAMIAALAVLVLGWEWINNGYQSRTFTLSERLMTEARVLWFYLEQTLLPNFGAFALHHDDFPVSRGLWRPLSTALSMLGWGAVLAALVCLRHRWPLLCLGMAWFLVGHGMESSVFALELVFEHRNYLPSIGLLFMLAWGGYLLIQKMPQRRRATVLVLALLPVLYLAGLSALRAQQLGDPLNGPLSEVARHPYSARANYAAAKALIAAGRGTRDDPEGWQLIRHHMLQAEARDPGFKGGHAGLVIWSCLAGWDVQQGWLDRLAYQLEFRPFAHSEAALHYQLLDALKTVPDCLSRQTALQLFDAAGRNRHLGALGRAGFLKAAMLYELQVARDAHSAGVYLTRALAVAPHDPELQEILGRLSAAGQAPQAGYRPQGIFLDARQ